LTSSGLKFGLFAFVFAEKTHQNKLKTLLFSLVFHVKRAFGVGRSWPVLEGNELFQEGGHSNLFFGLV